MKRLAAARGGVGLTPATAWRSGTRRTLCRSGTIVCVFARCGCWVCLMLNLQPEAGSEEFVRSSQLQVAPGQLFVAVSCELVWTSVLR